MNNEQGPQRAHNGQNGHQVAPDNIFTQLGHQKNNGAWTNLREHLNDRRNITQGLAAAPNNVGDRMVNLGNIQAILEDFATQKNDLGLVTETSSFS